MLKLLERNIASIEARLVIVSPPQLTYSGVGHLRVEPSRHRRLVQEMQKLRGSIYLSDGAIRRSDLSGDGLHETAEDERSWHLLMLDAHDRVSACVWYMEHEQDATFEDLRVRNCPLGGNPQWRDTLKRAVTSELMDARRHNLRYAEVGGWAVTKESRCTSEGLLLALAAYSLGRARGGALGMTTATVRHSSSTILRRIGGQALDADGVQVPDYYDPHYDCQMELLRFDSRRPNPRYAPLIDHLKEKLTHVTVVASSPALVGTLSESAVEAAA